MTELFSERSLRLPRKRYQDIFEHGFAALGQKDTNVLVFYGEDGLGKTELLRSLEKEYRSTCVVLNGAGMQQHDHLSVETGLFYLRNDLRRDGLVLQNFDIAYAYYWNWARPGQAFDLDNAAIQVDRRDIISTLGDLIGTIAQDLSTQIPFAGTISKLAWFLVRFGQNPKQHRDLIKQLDECADPYQFLERLPEFLMVTLREVLNETGRQVAILVDDYEAFLKEDGSFSWLEQMMAVENPYVLWVVTAKQPITALSTAQEVQMQPLSYTESLEWLLAYDIHHEAICRTISLAAQGIPFYLQVGIDTWKQIRKDRLPKAEDFAKTLEESLDRWGQVWQKKDLALMSLLSFDPSWDEALVTALVDDWQLGDRSGRRTTVMSSPFIEAVGRGAFRLHSLLSEHFLAAFSLEQRREIHQWFYDYYRSLYEAHWSEVILMKAAYHGLLGDSLEQTTQWLLNQVSALQEGYCHQAAIDLLQRVLQFDENLPLVLQAKARMQLGHSEVELERSREAQSVLKQAHLAWEALGQTASAEAATTQLDLARAYVQADNLFDGQTVALKAKQIRTELFGESSVEVAETLILLATIALRRENIQEAIALNEQAFQLFAEHPHMPAIEQVQPMKTQVVLLVRQKQAEEAENLCREVLQLAQERLGDEHPEAILSRALLGFVYEQMGEQWYLQALEQYQQALEVGEPILGANHPQILSLIQCLSKLNRKMGQVDAEASYAERYHSNVQVGNLEETIETALRLNNLGSLLYGKGQYGKAEPLYVRSLEIYESVLGGEHPDVALSLNNLAALYYLQGHYEQAEPLYRRSLEINEQTLGTDHPHTQMTQHNLDAMRQKMS
jgi:tetratricopeptide (TPR) repeat protein